MKKLAFTDSNILPFCPSRSKAMTDEELDELHERLRVYLEVSIRGKEEEARRYEREARNMRREAVRIRDAVKGERWWELRGLLSVAEIESLCEISPTNLLED